MIEKCKDHARTESKTTEPQPNRVEKVSPNKFKPQISFIHYQ